MISAPDTPTNVLYINDSESEPGKRFVPVTSAEDFPMIKILSDSYSGSWADYDNDGDLDLFVATGNNEPNVLFENNNGNSLFCC